MRHKTSLELLFDKIWDTPKDKFAWRAIFREHEEMDKAKEQRILDFLHSEITERRSYSSSKMCEEVIEFIRNERHN
jgi:hypothetical protein